MKADVIPESFDMYDENLYGDDRTKSEAKVASASELGLGNFGKI